MVNDCGSDGADDVSAPKQPGEIPGVAVLMKRENEKRTSGEMWGIFTGETEANRLDERMKA